MVNYLAFTANALKIPSRTMRDPYAYTKDMLEFTKGVSLIGNLPHRHSKELGPTALCAGFEGSKSFVLGETNTIERLAEAGVKQIRLLMTWNKYETAKGVYDFSWIDSMLDLCEKNSMQAWVTLGGVPCRFGSIHAPVEELPRVVTTPKHYAFLRIAEGCDNHCAYCIIPSLRGKYRSRKMEDVLAEAQQLADSGVKEIIVIAQDITRYGKDLYGEYCLDKLLESICSDPELDFKWIRLFYCYPDKITDELIEVMATEEKVVKYI